MIETIVHLISIPDELCVIERIDIRVLMRRAIRVEERMKKGVNIEDEQRRYQILCDRIEYLSNLLLNQGSVDSMSLGEEYLDLIIQVKDKFSQQAEESRLFGNFCPVEMVEASRKAFMTVMTQAGLANTPSVRAKDDFYRLARNQKHHVVEVQEMVIVEEEISSGGVDKTLTDAFLALKISDEIATGENAVPFVALRKTINETIAAINSGEAGSLNFSDVRHDVIAEIMYEFVYGKGQRMLIPVIYSDGSKAAPFPIRCLSPWRNNDLTHLRNLPMLNIGMMSQRHPELDPMVKAYWYRNQEISIGRSHAETDKVAYEKAKELFEKIRGEGNFRIGYYQTGFQPAVVGFYRALTEELVIRGDKKPSLEVNPFYFMGGVYRPGKPWS